ncbi:hypothetical protein [Mesorhizobium sp. 113-3-3]|uniref:hypothetical protein n=1 Tax=Mesorhizobium sp. 113-3-3 TaxID=2744516 RepID=UPI001934CE0B|nr:hypothetical protein [Mesorhizobium sp. 113-3-3]BCG79348.1 hypothetical protein MesoLj113b_28900 [Mesorhizobium sp. 113-3-3]
MNWNDWLSAVQHGGEASSLESTLSETSLPDVLDAQRSLYPAEESLLRSRVLLATDCIALNKALGGGSAVRSTARNPRSPTSRPAHGWRCSARRREQMCNQNRGPSAYGAMEAM